MDLHGDVHDATEILGVAAQEDVVLAALAVKLQDVDLFHVVLTQDGGQGRGLHVDTSAIAAERAGKECVTCIVISLTVSVCYPSWAVIAFPIAVPHSRLR